MVKLVFFLFEVLLQLHRVLLVHRVEDVVNVSLERKVHRVFNHGNWGNIAGTHTQLMQLLLLTIDHHVGALLILLLLLLLLLRKVKILGA